MIIIQLHASGNQILIHRLDLEIQATLNENHNATHYLKQDNLDNALDVLELSTAWKFEEHLYFSTTQLPPEEIYEEEVQAAVAVQYLSTVPAPVDQWRPYCDF